MSTCSGATHRHWSQPVYHRFPWFPLSFLLWLNSHLKIPLVLSQDSPRGRRHLLFVFCPLAAEDGQRRRWVCQEVIKSKPHGGFGKFLECWIFVYGLLSGALVYEQLGYKAFGMPGKLAASCSITMQNIGGETFSQHRKTQRSLKVTAVFFKGKIY